MWGYQNNFQNRKIIKEDKEKPLYIRERLEKLDKKLSENSKSKQFVSSLTTYFTSHDYLTKSQYNSLEKLEKQVAEEEPNWVYDKEKELNFNLCINYYNYIGYGHCKRSNYFFELREKVKQSKKSQIKFIPTQYQYKQICCNKFTTKLLIIIQ